MSGHGHVTPDPDGARVRCGGPALCAVCAKEKAALEAGDGPEPVVALEPGTLPDQPLTAARAGVFLEKEIG